MFFPSNIQTTVYGFICMFSFFHPMTIYSKWLHTPLSFNSSIHWSISFLNLSPLSKFPEASCRVAYSKDKIKTIWVYGLNKYRSERVLMHSMPCSRWSTQKSFRVAIQLVYTSQLIRPAVASF